MTTGQRSPGYGRAESDRLSPQDVAVASHSRHDPNFTNCAIERPEAIADVADEMLLSIDAGLRMSGARKVDHNRQTTRAFGVCLNVDTLRGKDAVDPVGDRSKVSLPSQL